MAVYELERKNSEPLNKCYPNFMDLATKLVVESVIHDECKLGDWNGLWRLLCVMKATKQKRGEKFSHKVEKYIRANHPQTLDSRGHFNYELILSIVGQKIGDRTFCINNVHL